MYTMYHFVESKKTYFNLTIPPITVNPLTLLYLTIPLNFIPLKSKLTPVSIPPTGNPSSPLGLTTKHNNSAHVTSLPFKDLNTPQT